MDGNPNTAAFAIEQGDRPEPFLAKIGGMQRPRICATTECNNMTEGVPSSDEPDAPLVYLSRYCERCVWAIRHKEAEARRAAANAKSGGSRIQWWNKTWKPDSIYHDTVLSRLPDLAASEKVMRWTPKLKKGILLVGDSGSGKTRTVYLLLKALLLEDGIYPTIKKCVILRHEIARAAKSSDELARPKMMKAMIDAPILYLDDLGQMANTASAEEALLTIVEERTQVGRPIIATSQLTGARFIQQFQMQERGEAIARRLGDFCYNIHFTRPTTPANTDTIP